MWSNERFSIIRTTMWSTFSRLARSACSGMMSLPSMVLGYPERGQHAGSWWGRVAGPPVPAPPPSLTRRPCQLACRGGRGGFLDSLVGDRMSLCGPAQFGELVSHEADFGHRSQHADSRFAPLQLPADPLAIGLVESQVLVVERAQQPAADQACGEPDRGAQRHDGADAGTLAPAALADLVRLELALLVQDQDAHGIPLRHPRVLQGDGRCVGRSLVIEDRQDYGLVRHEHSLLHGPGALAAPGHRSETRVCP